MSLIFTERARVAGLSRDRLPDDPDLVGARQRLKTARLRKAIAAEASSGPLLTPDQLAEVRDAVDDLRIAEAI